MNIKTIGFSILFMFSVGAQANVATVTSTVTRVNTVITATSGVTATSAFSSLSAAAASISARVVAAGTLNRLEEIAQTIENVAQEDSEVEGMSKALRIQTLANVFTVVALTDSPEVVSFVTGKPYTAASTPNAQGSDDVLDGDSVSTFNNLLNSVLASAPDAVGVAEMDSAIQADTTISANSLAEMGPCSSAGLATNR